MTAQRFPEGNAIVYCEGAFGTTNGKTAHGLVRRTRRYRVLSVVDSTKAGRDAGEVLDRTPNGIPVLAGISEAMERAQGLGTPATHLVVGLAPDGGRLAPGDREAVRGAVDRGLHLDSGLHDFLSEDPDFVSLASERGVEIRDVRRPPARDRLHFFSGKIEEVDCLKIALLGTDSAVGKRTTAWVLADALAKAGHPTEMVGTGQTAWLQGAGYGIILDSLVNDFVSGEIEHAVWSAWKETSPAAVIIEGQGSIMNPAYPGGFEILAAGRPDVIVIQHAPTRVEYDGFPGYPMDPLEKQIQVLELLSSKPVVAVTVNHEGLNPEDVPGACAEIRERTGLPAVDVLLEGADPLVKALEPHLRRN